MVRLQRLAAKAVTCAVALKLALLRRGAREQEELLIELHTQQSRRKRSMELREERQRLALDQARPRPDLAPTSPPASPSASPRPLAPASP